MVDTLKTDLVDRLKQVGAFDVGVADPRTGFDKALPGKHPLQLWDQCKSVIVFAIAMSPKSNIYLGPYAPWQASEPSEPGQNPRTLGPVPQPVQSEEHGMDKIDRLLRTSITMKGMMFLAERGYKTSFAETQCKLSAFEAGLGIYGRSGLILHPVLGNRMALGVILTDARLEADNRIEGYDPCYECGRCIKACPAKAFEVGKKYPESWNRKTCVAKRAEITGKGLYCQTCFAVCPAGQIDDDTLLSVKVGKNFLKEHRYRFEYGIEQRDQEKQGNERLNY